jgi:Cft2 family RNA processing exonuclease
MPTSGRPTKRGSHEPRLAYISVDFALRGIGVKLRIHRGTREIGGTCVELESNGSRILLDLGLPLAAADPNAVSLPAVAGLSEPDPALRAIVLSHGHRDHWGLLPKWTFPS